MYLPLCTQQQRKQEALRIRRTYSGFVVLIISNKQFMVQTRLKLGTFWHLTAPHFNLQPSQTGITFEGYTFTPETPISEIYKNMKRADEILYGQIYKQSIS